MRILNKPLKFVDGHGAGRFFFGSQAKKTKNTKSGFWERGNGLLHILVALTLIFIVSYYDSEILLAAETMYQNLYYVGYKQTHKNAAFWRSPTNPTTGLHTTGLFNAHQCSAKSIGLGSGWTQILYVNGEKKRASPSWVPRPGSKSCSNKA